MSVILKNLISEDTNRFKLSLCAGQNGSDNTVSWIYMLEDESIIPYLYGSELIVTSGLKAASDASWLMRLVRRLYQNHAAGLIVNTGKYVSELPDELIAFCDGHDFPVFTMPWEIRITEVIQNFCVKIISSQHENLLHDQAMRDAILKHDNVREYRDTLGKYYDLDGAFSVFCIYIRQSQGMLEDTFNREYLLESRIRRLKLELAMPDARICILEDGGYTLLVLNNAPSPMPARVRDLILEVYDEFVQKKNIFIGLGIEVAGLELIDKSYHRAVTAMRMALYRQTPVIRFEDMGFYKILFSVKDDEILYSYANEILAPLDRYDRKNHAYVELLRTYIRQNRSLAGTAQALYIHRNTVNYQIQKMKELLGSPLKTLEDLFPYQVALAIRDMEKHAG